VYWDDFGRVLGWLWTCIGMALDMYWDGFDRQLKHGRGSDKVRSSDLHTGV